MSAARMLQILAALFVVGAFVGALRLERDLRALDVKLVAVRAAIAEVEAKQ